MCRLARSVALFAALAISAASAQTPDSFEVASVKAMGPASAELLARFGAGCDGSFPRVENRRFSVTTTAYALMTWAYGFNKNGGCGFVTNGNFIVGGPAWLRSERFDVQAVMPESAPPVTTDSFLNGRAPALETMLRTLLADRFTLTIHREMRESPVYAMVPARGGITLPAAKAGEPVNYGIARRRDVDGQSVDHLIVSRANMTYIGIMLGIITRRPIVDRTGLTGEYSFDVPFAPQDAKPGETSPAASIFTAIQEQLGLRLEDTRAPVEVIVVDRVEKPTGN
jgi:uncharacterized protein (TIGR03435 family)